MSNNTEKIVPYSSASLSGNDLSIELGIKKNPSYIDPFSSTSIVNGYDLGKYHISDIPHVTPLTNEDFALLRAYDLYNSIYNKINYTFSTYNLNTRISDKSGSRERLVIIKVRIKNALKKKYYEMNENQRKIFNSLN